MRNWILSLNYDRNTAEYTPQGDMERSIVLEF